MTKEPQNFRLESGFTTDLICCLFKGERSELEEVQLLGCSLSFTKVGPNSGRGELINKT